MNLTEVNKMREVLKKVLSNGPRRPKKFVSEVMKKTGKSKSTVFYWLDKLEKEGKIQKTNDGRYEFWELEEVSKEELDFLLPKLKNKDRPRIQGEALRDFIEICGKKKMSSSDRVWVFIGESLGGFYGLSAKAEALKALRLIHSNSMKIGNQEAIDRTGKYTEQIKELILDKDLDLSTRDLASSLLDKVLQGEEHYKVLMDILRKLIRQPLRDLTIRLIGNVWKSILEKHLNQRKIELWKFLYLLLGSKDNAKRHLASFLLHEIRYEEIRKFKSSFTQGGKTGSSHSRTEMEQTKGGEKEG